MRKFHSIAALCGDGLRPELQALFDRLAVDPHSELFVRREVMTQSGPDPIKVPNVKNGPRKKKKGARGGKNGPVPDAGGGWIPNRRGSLGQKTPSPTFPHKNPPRQPIKNLELDEEI